MPGYSREQIYKAMRRADAAGDGEAVKALAAALQAGAGKDEILDIAKQNNVTVDEPALDANIQARDAGKPTNTFVEKPSTLQQLGTGTVNALAGAAQGVAGTYDMLSQGAGFVQRGANALLGTVGSGILDMVGAHDLASAVDRGTQRADNALANMPTASGSIERAFPTPEGMGGARLAAQIVGGAMVPMGPKAAPRPVKFPTAPANEIVAAGQREGVRVMTSDVKPPQSFVGKGVRTMGERIPFAGTGGPRLKQQQERVEAVKQLAKDFGVEGAEDGLDEVSNDLAKTRGGKIKALTARKDKVIDGLQGAVQTPKAIAEIDAQIVRLKGINDAKLAPVIKELESFKGVLTSGKSLREIEENRKILGDMFADQNLASVKGVGQKAINAIYNPLREDMGAFIKANGGEEAFNTWKRTNDELAGMAGELDASTFKNVLQNSETTPEKVAGLLFSKKPSDVRRLFANLSPAGQEKAKAAVIFEAIQKAGGIEDVSPERFANSLKAFGKTTGIIFGDDAPRIQGVVRLLRATQQASVAAAHPPTGVQNAVPVLAAVLTDWLGSAGAAITTGSVAGLAARLYESAPVRNLLIGLGKTKPGSKAEGAAMTRIAKVLSSQAGVQNAGKGLNDNVGVSAAAGDRKEQQKQQ